MKMGPKLRGILMIAAGIGLGIVERFGLMIILVLAGLFTMCLPGSAPKPAEKKSAQVRKTNVVIADDTTGAPAADAYAFRGTVDEYFRQILSNCFPGYSVQCSTSVTAGLTGAQDWGYFTLIKNGKPCAVILLVDKYHWHTQEIIDAMKQCQRSRIPCLRFIRQFRNQAGYVIGRINGVLR